MFNLNPILSLSLSLYIYIYYVDNLENKNFQEIENNIVNKLVFI